MTSFVYAVWSITNIASMHCAVRPEISPCTCEPIYASNTVDLSCEKVDSFHRIVDALSDKFDSNISISLQISHSQLEDLEMRSFREMNLNLKKLKMVANNLRWVPVWLDNGARFDFSLHVGDKWKYFWNKLPWNVCIKKIIRRQSNRSKVNKCLVQW